MVAEVEIISLLEEQIPRYRLRADALTEFAGYGNQDWQLSPDAAPCPPLPDKTIDKPLGLSTELIRETLNYFRKYPSHTSQHLISAMFSIIKEEELFRVVSKIEHYPIYLKPM